jgi:hypothetical protein
VEIHLNIETDVPLTNDDILELFAVIEQAIKKKRHAKIRTSSFFHFDS